MENKITLPTLDDLINKVEDFNSKYPEYSYGINIDLLKQSIDILNYSSNFVLYLIKNNYDSQYENPYVIYGQLVHYMKYCHNNGDFNEIKKILKFVDKKLQDKNEYINTLAQIGVLENFDIYPEILPDIVDMMPKYSKEIFLKYYSKYLK